MSAPDTATSPSNGWGPAPHDARRPVVSVVICAYSQRRWRALLAAVASVVAQTLPPLETIVVIDHNPDLLERAKAALADARVLDSEGPRGLSAARNTGVNRARGEVVAFLDDDAAGEPTWLENLIAAYEDPHVLGTGGAVRPKWTGAESSRWLPPEFYWTIGCSYRGLPTQIAPVRNPIGANMSFRRSALQRVDGFSTDIGRVGRTPLGCEETELSIRLLRAHPEGRLVYVPAARVEHLVPTERARWRYFRSRCWAEGLSKALVSERVGAAHGLSSERAYALRTLPSGAVRGLSDALRGDPAGLLRSGAIAAGLALTTAGYLRGRLLRDR